MILEIKRLLAKGQYSGDFSLDYEPSQDMLLLPLCRFEGAVKVEGSFEIFENDEVEVNLKISYALVGQCSYCLKDAKKSVEYSMQALFVTKEDGENYGYDGYKLDLTSAVNDALLFSQPSVLLCREGCEGITIK